MAADDDTSPPMEAIRLPAFASAAVAPTTPPVTQLPPVVGGKYRPLRLIAKGGMGAIDEVVHVNTGEHLALKLMLSRSLLTPELVERFRREARVHSAVRSEHVVRIVDADVAPELDDAPFIVMELLEGQDFERICLQRRPSATEVVDWMRQLAATLDRAHREGIVHRDLKPENLFLAERADAAPMVKILDFGIAKITEEGAGPSTATGQILGTPRYMAPEQAIAAKEVSAAVDRFALGLITFRLLCGRHYFLGDNWFGLLRDVARGPVTRPSEMGCDRGRAFDAWFAKACAIEPRARFDSCVEQVGALGLALDGAFRPARTRTARRWMWVAFAGALAVVGWRLEHKGTPAAAHAVVGAERGRAGATGPAPPAVAPTPVSPRAQAREARIETGGPSLSEPHPALRQRKRRAARADALEVKVQATKPLQRDRIWDEP